MRSIRAIALSIAVGTILATQIPAQAAPPDIVIDAPCPQGTGALAPTDIERQPDGTTVVHYLISGMQTLVTIPSQQFDPLTASDSEIERAGLPARPYVPSKALEWNRDFRNWRRNPNATLCVGSVVHETSSNRMTNGTFSNGIWSGYGLTNAASGTYIAVQGDFTQPSRGNSCTGSAMSSWVGLGGYSTGKLIQTGTGFHIGSNVPYAWYEYLNTANQNPEVVMNGVTLQPGNGVHTYVVIQKSTGQTTFYVYNTTTGSNQSVVLNLSVSSYYDGTSAEWIDERPSVNNTPTPLTNFGSINWTNVKAQNASGTWLNFGDNSPTRFRMANAANATLAAPSTTPGSTTFTDTFYQCQ